jgi:Ice-binding-like
MRNPNAIVPAPALSRLKARLAAAAWLAALFSAVPFQAALAQTTAPSLGAASRFAVLSAAPGGGGAVTCTGAIINGDVGSSGLPAAVVQTEGCVITGAIIAPVSATVLANFNTAYADLANVTCTVNFVQAAFTDATLALDPSPAVNCFTADVTFTRTKLTLNGGVNDTWLIKVGTQAVGALTGTGLSVALPTGASACNVTWWVEAAATMTDSDFRGTLLAGAAITTTRGTFAGRALAKAAVTMTGGSLIGCGALAVPKVKHKCDADDDDDDNDDEHHHDKDHERDHDMKDRDHDKKDRDHGKKYGG